VERKVGEISSRVHMTEISAPLPNTIKHKKLSEITYSPDVPSDFPVIMHVSSKHGVLYIGTKFGHVFVYELSTGSFLLRQSVSQESVFIGARNSINDGLLLINRSGSLLSTVLDENNYIPYFLTNCSYIPDHANVAFRLAAR
jgi:clathrin heavy chain